MYVYFTRGESPRLVPVQRDVGRRVGHGHLGRLRRVAEKGDWGGECSGSGGRRVDGCIWDVGRLAGVP